MLLAIAIGLGGAEVLLLDGMWIIYRWRVCTHATFALRAYFCLGRGDDEKG
jgi:hypothetical protein